MAQSKDTPKSSGTSKSTRRTRRKPRPVTIDLEATEVGQDKSGPETVQKDSPQKPADRDTAATGSPQTDENLTQDGATGDETSSAGMRGPFSMDATIALHAIPYALAAFIGGLLSLVIYVWFAGLGWLPGTSGPETVRMNSEIGILRNNIEKISSELQTITGETIDGARSRLTALEAGSAKVNDLKALESQVTALQSRLAASEQAQTSSLETTADLLDRINAAETTLNATNDLLEDFRRQFAEVSRLAGEEGDIANLTALSDRISSLETVLQEITAASGSASPASALQIAGLRGELQTAMDNLTAAQQQLQTKVTAMDGQLIALQETSQDMAVTMSNVNQAASERLQAMDNALAALEIRRDAGPVSQMERRAAMALSFASLARAVETGKPFRAELDTARAFAGDQPGLDVLGAHADTGLETVKSLTERFAAVAGQIVNAGHKSAEGGALDRFWGKLQSIVRVRPTGFVAGDTSAAIVARAESQLQAGQLSEAITELEKLSGPALEAAQGWLEPARARRDGEAALAALNADLIASITMVRSADEPDTTRQTGTEKDAGQ